MNILVDPAPRKNTEPPSAPLNCEASLEASSANPFINTREMNTRVTPEVSLKKCLFFFVSVEDTRTLGTSTLNGDALSQYDFIVESNFPGAKKNCVAITCVANDGAELGVVFCINA